MTTNKQNSPWTDELRAKVKALWSDHSATQIAEALNAEGHTFTRNAIVGLLHRSKLTSEHKTEERKGTRERGHRTPKIPVQTRMVRVSNAVGGNGHDRVFRTISVSMKLRCIEIEPRNVSLIDLEPGDCRYPYGDGPILFCGHPRQKGSSFCTPHHHLCWTPPLPRRVSYFGRAA